MFWRRTDPDGDSGIKLEEDRGDMLVTVWTGRGEQTLRLSREDAESLARAVAEWVSEGKRPTSS